MKQLRSELMSLGLKATPQRMAILEFLKESKNHPAAENIHHELLNKYPGISLTTIYSTLAKLLEKQKIMELDIDPGKKRFDACLEPHDHFYCRVCGKVYDIFHNTESWPNNSRSNNIEGHHVDEIGINLKGVCKNCEFTPINISTECEPSY
ncbi:MAG: Fur family transcriptional regulator [Smithellaceae bacterium]